MIGQYLELRKRNIDPDPLVVGLVSLKCSPKDIAEDAVRDAAYMCSRIHGDAPDVTFHGQTDLHFPYVSSHLSYIMLELLKNSMRATVEKHGVNKMPPIRIVIAGGEDNEDVCTNISLCFISFRTLTSIIYTYLLFRWLSKYLTKVEVFRGLI